MNSLRQPMVVVCLALGALTSEAESARVQLNCFSMQFATARSTIGGFKETLDISSEGINPPNGELSLAGQGIPATHQGSFRFFDGIDVYELPFIFDIDTTDANNNQIWDVLEVEGESYARTYGQYVDPAGDIGTFRADWTKAIGSATGLCIITFDFGDVFRHGFGIYQYSTTIDIDANAGTGEKTIVVDMNRDGVPGQKLSGNLTLKFEQGKVTALAKSALKNENDQPFSWTVDTASELTNKRLYCFLDVVDGTPYDPTYADYNEYVLMIDSAADTDNDGVPNIVDGGQVTLPTAPRLEIVTTQNGVRVLVYGDVGSTYTLESAVGLPAASWANATAVNIAASPQAVDLPAPSTLTFWRARFP